MDNITHSLIGATLGFALTYKRPKMRNAVLWTTVIGNNFPDIDFVIRPFLTDPKFGYLLHHRGYTHSILAALVLGFLAAWISYYFTTKKKTPPLFLTAIGVFSVLLHIGADFWNDYGVHPFPPLNQNWYYGDFIFIVEPWLWISLLPLVFFSSVSKAAKITSVVLSVLLLGLIWSGFFMSLGLASLITLIGTVLVFLQMKTKHFLPAVISFFITLGVFFVGSRQAREKIHEFYSTAPLKLYQLTSSPAPGNPFCWSTAAVFVEKQDYVVRLMSVSLFPRWFSAESCYPFYKHARLIPLSPMPEASQKTLPSHLYALGEFRRPVSEFLNLMHENCTFKTFIKFSRTPAWIRTSDYWIVEDIRYDQTDKFGFSSIDLNTPTSCEGSYPPWNPPLSELVKDISEPS